jgi:2,4-dienoyl-CoA reductase-like NADH-dependent reductase (Old Yellow Enzyme family)
MGPMTSQSKLFTAIQFRELTVKNRIFMAPMCQYSSDNSGEAKAWHMAHYGARASGGIGLIIQEATAVSPEGRISAQDLGLWNQAQAKSMLPITDFIKSQGCVPAVQLAHAGRKGNAGLPIVGPSSVRFDETYAIPAELDAAGLKKVHDDFIHSAQMALEAGFQVIEVHAAHGYLLHEFLSPLSNIRKDEYGGSLENRMRFPLQVIESLRKIWPARWPVFVRLSATDWALESGQSSGWDLSQTVIFCERLKAMGIDFIDCSTGGLVPNVKIPLAPGYQVPFAQEIRAKVHTPTGAVGLITTAAQAEEILKSERADVVLFAREFLRNPYWALTAAKELNAEIKWPTQYERAKN